MTVTLSPHVRWDRACAPVLLLMAVALVAWNGAYRTVEVVLAGRLIRLFTSDGVYVSTVHHSVYFGLGGDRPFGLRMSPKCTSMLLVLALLLIAAVMIALRPVITRQVLGALGVAMVLLVLLNQLRMLMFVGLVNWFGTNRGYILGHTMLGSLVSVLGGAASLVLFVWLVTRSPRNVSA